MRPKVPRRYKWRMRELSYLKKPRLSLYSSGNRGYYLGVDASIWEIRDMGQQKLPLGTGNREAENREYGPSWKDVNAIAKEAMETFGKQPYVAMQPIGDAEGRWGLRYVVYVFEGRWKCGIGVFGTTFPGNGQKTMCAAVWHAYHQLIANPIGVSERERSWLTDRHTTATDGDEA